MTICGYARVSTTGQSFNEQKDSLKNSGTTTTRSQFEKLVHLIESTYTLIVGLY